MQQSRRNRLDGTTLPLRDHLKSNITGSRARVRIAIILSLRENTAKKDG